VRLHDTSDASHGARKAACEAAARSAFGDRATIVRPGTMVGPHDATDRLSYWPQRVAAGGRVLAPGDRRDPVRFIDVRDLGDFVVQLAEMRRGGVFNATGETISFASVLDACRVLTRSRAPAANGAALGDRTPQLGGRRAETVGMLRLDHRAERPHLRPPQSRAPRLESSIEQQREVAMTSRDAGPGSGGSGESANDTAWHANGFAREVDLDGLLLCHA
jgi:nucleoside-diphosphate-sugar epimerase